MTYVDGPELNWATAVARDSAVGGSSTGSHTQHLVKCIAWTVAAHRLLDAQFAIVPVVGLKHCWTRNVMQHTIRAAVPLDPSVPFAAFLVTFLVPKATHEHCRVCCSRALGQACLLYWHPYLSFHSAM